MFRQLIHACISLIVFSAAASVAQGQKTQDAGYTTVKDVAYRDGETQSEYSQQMCRLDVYYPTGKQNYATVVWFHGGGLKNGKREVPQELMNQGVAVVAVDYRLHPQVKSPTYIEDSAAAVAWTFKNIKNYQGDPEMIFLSGHSAGGYLTSMIGLDKRWLAAHDVDANEIAGLIPFSGHTITHFTIRDERGIDGKRPIVDEMAPLFHVRKDCAPLLLITGDRELEMLGRYEENAYLWRMMQVVEHPNTELHELDGYNHGQMAGPAFPILLRFISKTIKQLRKEQLPKKNESKKSSSVTPTH